MENCHTNLKEGVGEVCKLSAKKLNKNPECEKKKTNLCSDKGTDKRMKRQATDEKYFAKYISDKELCVQNIKKTSKIQQNKSDK